MQLTEFNDLAETDAAALVRPCVDIDSFVETVVAARPYGSMDALEHTAQAQSATWTDAEIATALADHPRIGERHEGAGSSAAMSRSEQGGLGEASDLEARLTDGNRRYEERFDRVFLVRAAGRDAEEILSLLEQRLTHDDETERAVVAGQLAEIAWLRLKGLLS